ncbi:MAG: hypothetical protein K2M07_01740 [Muribaculaceae bacterium]|nr:hypothetical protein [Muribaculaceae bacterium]
MKKFFISAALICSGFMAYAQLVNVESVQRVNLPSTLAVNKATISPDGTFAVVSDLGSTALNSVDLASGRVSTITDNGSGVDVRISDDNQTVVYRQITTNKNHLRQTAVRAHDMSTGSEQQILKPTRNLNGVAINGTEVVAIEKGKARTKNLGKNKVSRPVVSIQEGHLNVTVNGKTTTLDPQGRSSYLWPSLSPDGTKVLYWVAFEGCFVCDLDGSNPVKLGELRAARWINDNLVVGQRDHDNGDYITDSELIASDLNGTKQVLTDASVVALNPSVSADGKKIAFTTNKGELYILNLK